MHLKTKKLFTVLLAALGLSAAMPRLAEAEFCTWCVEHFGCWFGVGDGWISCTNIGGTGCLLEGECTQTFASVGFVLDGTRLAIASERSVEADQLTHTLLEVPPATRDAHSTSFVESYGGVTYIRRGCDNSIVSRTYSSEVGDALRESSHNIE